MSSSCVDLVSSCLLLLSPCAFFFFFFNDTATTEIYTLSLHDALPICGVFRKNDDNNHWHPVNEGSKHWKEAHGWSYFHLPDEFDFSSRYDAPLTMLDLSAEKDKAGQKLCMWDI